MEKSVNFIDATVHLENDRLWTDFYCKDMDSHNYLYYTSASAHPKHCKTSLPYSQLLRLKRIRTFECDFLKHSGMLLAHFQRRGYPVEVLQQAMDKVKELNRQNLLDIYNPAEEEAPDKEREKLVSLLTDYTPLPSQCDDLVWIVRKNWGIVQKSSTTKDSNWVLKTQKSEGPLSQSQSSKK